MAGSDSTQGKPKPGGDGGGRGRTRKTTESSTPLIDRQTYTDGEGFEPGNAAASDKYLTVDGKVVDDLKGEQGWQIAVKGDVVTPAMARTIAGRHPHDDGKG